MCKYQAITPEYNLPLNIPAPLRDRWAAQDQQQMARMRSIESMVIYRQADGRVLLTYRFKAPGQLLDEGEPTPLPEKELTEEAEEVLEGHLDEYLVSISAGIVIELQEQELATTPPR